ncbi:hypothetical protein J6590_056112 [Homalodisca vitripennis]|nr:hypothetical protein J6590_056112 [Homalodisca vitripennis]
MHVCRTYVCREHQWRPLRGQRKDKGHRGRLIKRGIRASHLHQPSSCHTAVDTGMDFANVSYVHRHPRTAGPIFTWALDNAVSR